MKSNAFIVTKPLQLMVALSIIDQLQIADTSHLIVIDSFAGSRGVAERIAVIQKPLPGISAELLPSVSDAYKLLRGSDFSSIFIDADVGFRKYLDLIRLRISHPRMTINVYEEGLGTYRPDLYRGIKQRAFQAAGIGTHFGGCSLTSAVYVYDSQEYQTRFPKSRVSAIKIETALVEFVRKYLDNLKSIFAWTSPVVRDRSSCALYLTSWDVRADIVDQVSSCANDHYIKPHPHIVDFKALSPQNVISACFPAEIVLLWMIDVYDTIIVYHHGSSVARYIKSEKIKYVELN